MHINQNSLWNPEIKNKLLNNLKKNKYIPFQYCLQCEIKRHFNSKAKVKAIKIKLNYINENELTKNCMTKQQKKI